MATLTCLVYYWMLDIGISLLVSANYWNVHGCLCKTLKKWITDDDGLI